MRRREEPTESLEATLLKGIGTSSLCPPVDGDTEGRARPPELHCSLTFVACSGFKSNLLVLALGLKGWWFKGKLGSLTNTLFGKYLQLEDVISGIFQSRPSLLKLCLCCSYQ